MSMGIKEGGAELACRISVLAENTSWSVFTKNFCRNDFDRQLHAIFLGMIPQIGKKHVTMMFRQDQA